MRLSELLKELRENILHDRSSRFGGDDDALWSDETLVRYINEAQRRFARRSLVLRDGTTPTATRITLVAGQTIYALHPSVLGVISAKVTGLPGDLARAGHSALGTFQAPDNQYWDPSSLATLPPGAPRVYTTDEDLSPDSNGSLSIVNTRVYPVPDAVAAGTVLQLRVVRLPLVDLTIDHPNATPELPQDHHIEMLDWAAYLALRIVDLDEEAPARGKEFAASFEANVKLARDASMRKLFTPLQWGFGRNGWAW